MQGRQICAVVRCVVVRFMYTLERRPCVDAEHCGALLLIGVNLLS